MNPKVLSGLNLLNLVRQQTDRIGVAVSFGKDSLATLDLACRLFKNVVGWHHSRVVDLDIVEGWRKAVERRFGMRIIVYPHFDLSRIYRHAVLMPHYRGLENTPKVSFNDMESKFRADAGVDWIAYGWRRNDSFSRTMIMKATGGYDPKGRRVYPLRSFSRSDVYDYLKERNISPPPKLGREEQSGLDLHPAALACLSVEDLRKWNDHFPFTEMQLRFSPQLKQRWAVDAQRDKPGADENPKSKAPRRKRLAT